MIQGVLLVASSDLFVIEIIDDNRMSFFRTAEWEIIYPVRQIVLSRIKGDVSFQRFPIIGPFAVIYFFV